MPSTIRPNRTEVSRNFPVLGFTIRTGIPSSWFEVAIASDPALLSPEGKPRRTPRNFFSTHASGPLPAERGDAVYLVPPSILAQFVGTNRLYYALATFRRPDGSNPEIVRLPPEVAQPVFISRSFTGMSRRIGGDGAAAGRGGYGEVGTDGRSLEWAGDEPVPGKSEPLPAAPAAGGAKPDMDNGGAAASGGARPGSGPASAAPAAAAAADVDFEYDDGLGPLPPGAVAEDSRAGAVSGEPDPDDQGIDGPIPDSTGPTERAVAAGVPRSLAGDTSEYPGASRFEPAAAANYRRTGSARTIERIVIHITDGGASIEGPISWFKNPAAKASAHYIVGQDGEVVQMVHHDDVAWHAHHANATSIGIEHVANTHGLVPTAAEYAASAALVRWLCQCYGLPVDRQHVLGHSEADPKTTHTGCPNAAWDWSAYMDLLAQAADDGARGDASAQNGAWRQGDGDGADGERAAVAASGLSTATVAGEQLAIAWNDVELVPQLTPMSCWAAAAAMVVGWRQRISIDPAQIAAGQGPWAAYYQTGLNVDDVDELARAWGLTAEPPQSYTVDGFARLLEDKGPLWVGVAVPTGHAVTVVGLSGDGTPDGTTVVYHDPWPPGTGRAAQTATYRQFMREYEAQLTTEPAGNVNIQVLHAGGRPSPAGAAQAFASRTRAPARPLGGESFDINWSDVQLLAQTKDDNCWATAAAMVAGWATRTSFAILDTPVPASLDEAAARFGLQVEPAQSFPIEGVRQLLVTKGPLWAAADQPFGASVSFHAVVITGMCSGGAPDGSDTFLYVLDPWDREPGTPGHPGPHTGTHVRGSRYSVSWKQFLDELETAVTKEPGWMWVRFMHAYHTGLRTPGTGAQGLALSADVHERRPDGNRARSARGLVGPAVAAIPAAIVGSAMTRIMDNEGDVSWELDQLRGLKHPHDDKAQAGGDSWHHMVTRVDGPHAMTVSGYDHIYADFEVRWEWNGRSLGNVTIAPVKVNDAIAASLRVKALIQDEAEVYRKRGGHEEPFAALHVLFTYDFGFTASDDYLAHTMLTLYGAGQIDFESRWTE